jgi:hypothetical protein
MFVMVFIITPLWLTPSSAKACDCDIPDTAKEALDRATAVFVGTVEKIQSEKSGNDVIFKVSKTWKGTNEAEIHVFTPHGSCQYNFQEGAAYLVYATSFKNSGILTVHDCGRTAPLPKVHKNIVELDKTGNLKNEVNFGAIHFDLNLSTHLLRIGLELILKSRFSY